MIETSRNNVCLKSKFSNQLACMSMSMSMLPRVGGLGLCHTTRKSSSWRVGGCTHVSRKQVGKLACRHGPHGRIVPCCPRRGGLGDLVADPAVGENQSWVS